MLVTMMQGGVQQMLRLTIARLHSELRSIKRYGSRAGYGTAFGMGSRVR